MNLKKLKQIRDQRELKDGRLYSGNMSVGGNEFGDVFGDEFDEVNPFYNERNDKRGRRGARPSKMRNREEEVYLN